MTSDNIFLSHTVALNPNDSLLWQLVVKFKSCKHSPENIFFTALLQIEPEIFGFRLFSFALSRIVLWNACGNETADLEEYRISERTLRRYLQLYREGDFEKLKSQGHESREKYKITKADKEVQEQKELIRIGGTQKMPNKHNKNAYIVQFARAEYFTLRFGV